MKFSIIIPTYNRDKFIRKTIESALNQTYKNFELIVVDDGSADDTKAIVNEIDDKRISYHYTPNQERGAARNAGAELAKGEYLYFLDSDDLLYSNHLEVALSFIDENNPEIFFQQYDITTKNGVKKLPYVPKKLILNDELVVKGNFISCHGVFIKRSLFRNIQFNEDRKLSGSEDYELWLRIAARYPILYSAKVTSTLVIHSLRSVTTMNAESLIQRKELMLKYLFSDMVFLEKYSKKKSFVLANAYAYLAIHLSLIGKSKTAVKYMFKTLKVSPSFIFKKRFYSFIKSLF